MEKYAFLYSRDNSQSSSSASSSKGITNTLAEVLNGYLAYVVVFITDKKIQLPSQPPVGPSQHLTMGISFVGDALVSIQLGDLDYILGVEVGKLAP